MCEWRFWCPWTLNLLFPRAGVKQSVCEGNWRPRPLASMVPRDTVTFVSDVEETPSFPRLCGTREMYIGSRLSSEGGRLR